MITFYLKKKMLTRKKVKPNPRGWMGKMVPVYSRSSALSLLLIIACATYLIYFTQQTSHWTELQTKQMEKQLLTMRNHSHPEHLTNISLSEKPIPETNLTIDREFFNYLANHLRNTSYPGVDNYIRYTVARLGLAPLVGVEPLIPEFGPVINDVLSFTFPISIPPCHQDHVIASNQTIVLLVNSAPANFDRRKIIRQTWKNHLKAPHVEADLIAGFAFVLALTENNETQNQIEEEANVHGDIIQIGISDFYRNLSLKVAGLFYWLYKNCAKVDFVAKVDDDVYINVRNLAHFVQTYRQSNRSMFGSAARNLWPARDGKWNMTFEDWPWNDYPPYFLGPAVLFPSSTILPLLAALQTTPMMPIDDVYYSGMCTEKARVELGFSSNSTSVFTMGMPSVPSPCELRRFVAWMTVSQSHMNNSHLATEDFYLNVTQCIIVTTEPNGINSTVDYSEPVQFYFSTLISK